jgi:TonB family protein
MKHLFLLAAFLGITFAATARDESQEFKSLLARATQLSSLTVSGSAPFHLKLHAGDPKNEHPEFAIDIELWWAAPDKWRRQITSPIFSQTAVQNGQHYSESNSSDYLPWWLYELISDPLDPLPLEEVKNANVELSGSPDHRCAEWQSEFAPGPDKIGIHNSVCFSADGTVQEAFTRTSSAHFGRYRTFGSKRVPESLELSAKSAEGRYVDLVGRLPLLEPLQEDATLFVVKDDTGLSARARFVSVPESALKDYRLDAPPMQWPPVHNFPATGLMTINLRIDRDGTIREIDSAISKNVVLQEPAVEQVKKWKFRPFLVDGSPVQVNTDISIRFEAQRELLGSNGASLPGIPFFERIKKSRELSELHMESNKHFHLHATVQYADHATGSYNELWQSPLKWKREAVLESVSVTESQNGDLTYREIIGSDVSPRQVDAFLDELNGHFPRTDGSFFEGDWGQSAVQLHGIGVVRVARGQVDANNQPTSGQAYWFDSYGLLQAAYVAPLTSTYSDFSDWNGKLVPRSIEVTEKDNMVLRFTIDQIEKPQSLLSDSMFALEGVKPEKISNADDYQGPALVLAVPIHRVRPIDPHAGHGTVILQVKLDEPGHVRTTQVLRSASKALDDAAVQAAMQWEFSPMRIRAALFPALPGSNSNSKLCIRRDCPCEAVRSSAGSV